MSPADRDEDDLLTEDVERRGEPRGLFPGMTATILEGAYAGTRFHVDEASRRGLFLKVDAPDSIPLGTRFVLEVAYRTRTLRLGFEVVRKEISPRRGVAGTIEPVDEASGQLLDELLAAAAAAAD